MTFITSAHFYSSCFTLPLVSGANCVALSLKQRLNQTASYPTNDVFMWITYTKSKSAFHVWNNTINMTFRKDCFKWTLSVTHVYGTISSALAWTTQKHNSPNTGYDLPFWFWIVHLFIRLSLFTWTLDSVLVDNGQSGTNILLHSAMNLVVKGQTYHRAQTNRMATKIKWSDDSLYPYDQRSTTSSNRCVKTSLAILTSRRRNLDRVSCDLAKKNNRVAVILDLKCNESSLMFYQKHQQELSQLQELLRERTKENRRLKSSFESIKELNDNMKKQVRDVHIQLFVYLHLELILVNA